MKNWFEELKALNQKVQKPAYKTKGNWYVRHILREAALPVTWLLLRTPVTANQVTLISLAVSVLGMFFLALPGPAAFVWGVLMLQLWYYLDHVDGQIARYRKTDSLTGRFLDFLTHHIVHTVLLFAMGFYVFNVTQSIFFIVWGFAAACGIYVFNVIYDVKYKAFFEKVENLRLDGDLILKRQRESSSSVVSRRMGFARRVFSFAHKLCEIHVMMNLLTLAALLQLAVSAFDFRIFLFFLYGLTGPALASIKIFNILKTRQIDSDFSAFYDSSHQ